MKKIFFLLFCINIFIGSIAQVGIGTTNPTSSAQLEVSANNKGFLPPRIALAGAADVSTIIAPVAGLLIYNTATAGVFPLNVSPGFYYYTGLQWQRINNVGNASGDIQYWNGTQWVMIPAGANGQSLNICGGVPQWGPCASGGLPVVITSAISSIAADNATSGGEVIGDGGAVITARGVCISTAINPTLANTVFTAASTGPGTYVSNISGLLSSTKYYVRAYATNANGTAYGANYSFTTLAGTKPTVVNYETASITPVSAIVRSQIVSNGNGTISASGVCYATTANPTTSNSIVASSATLGVYYCTLTGLTPGTLYHVRAYATNGSGTAYGTDSTFTTAAAVAPTLTTNAVTNVGWSSVVVGGNITNDGGAPITERGVCYSTSINPTAADETIINAANGIGVFTDTTYLLQPTTTYHMRAYAINAVDTAYGQDISFTTLEYSAFSAKFTFDSVKTNSGTTDPTPLPIILGATITPITAVGVGANSSVTNRFSFPGWSLGATNGSDVFTSATDTLTKYYEFTIAPQSGHTLTLTSLTFKVQRSGTGPRQYFVRAGLPQHENASINPANANLTIAATNKFQIADNVTTAQDGSTIIFSSFVFTNMNYPTTIRIYGINAEASGGTFSIDDVTINGYAP